MTAQASSQQRGWRPYGGPGFQYDEKFTLHSGAEIRLVGSRHGWFKVALPGGEIRGWMPAHTVEAVGRWD